MPKDPIIVEKTEKPVLNPDTKQARVQVHLLTIGDKHYATILLNGMNKHQATVVLTRLGSTCIKNGVGIESDFEVLTRAQLMVVESE